MRRGSPRRRRRRVAVAGERCATQGWPESCAPSCVLRGRAEHRISDAARPSRPRWRPGRGKPVARTTAPAANLPEAVRENEEVVPVNAVSTWVLPSGVTVGR
ncbi:hypothetical protein EOT10_30600 [Streptomyces antnestii]|uniref:Uncharacterized protein n=1 Tax=Streptomyces antnestii TaxID=2494256 RepID=A0A437P991_9ACTN|nr:hypothetical protein EOT10_30600 [Streptomyces sp. San01]